MLLDTTFLADFQRGLEAAKNKIFGIRGETLLVSSVSIAELSSGMKNYSEEQKNRARIALESLTIIPVTFELAWSAGQIASHLKKEGLEIGLPDCIIAATALSLNHSVLTRNVEHFKRVIGLRVETY